MYNLLTQDLIRYSRNGPKQYKASLPDLYQALMEPPGTDNPVVSFPAVRPHHRHAWHSFLVQLAFIALTKAQTSQIPTKADEWESIIRDLTPQYQQDEPWSIIVTDPTKPAFMQPPISTEDHFQAYKKPAYAPDLIDMLVTSKNHDNKRGVASNHQLDDWIMALITTQTMDGSPGRLNYGISRMNKGHSSRPALSLAPTDEYPGIHIRRDIQALLGSYQPPEWQHGHISLLWTEPWDGEKGEYLPKESLAPLYIEICRRFRLMFNPGHPGHPGRIYSLKAGSQSPRIHNEELKGRTGDPWVPTNAQKEDIPLSFLQDNANHNWLATFLTEYEKWNQPDLLLPTPQEESDEQPMTLLLRAMSRGQGATNGYYETRAIIGPNIKRALANADERETLRIITGARQQNISKVKWAMKMAMQAYILCDDPGTASRNDAKRAQKMVEPCNDDLNYEVNKYFFSDLEQEMADHPDHRDLTRSNWLTDHERGIVPTARRILLHTLDSMPPLATHQVRARAMAEMTFQRATANAKDIGPYLAMQDQDQDQDHTATTKEDNKTKTAAPPAETAPPPGTEPVRPICTKMAREAYSPRELDQLSRMNPEKPELELFYSILKQHEIEPPQHLIPAWGSIVQGIALTTKDKSTDQSAHSPRTPVGRALNAGNLPFRERPLCREGDFDLIMSSTGAPMRTNLSRLFKFLAQEQVSMDWEEMASFILSDAESKTASNPNRLKIAADYVAA